jgi:hypothetical protein
MADAEEYVARARAAILAIIATEYAVVHPELEARISEAGNRDSDDNIDPHHVTTALRELRDAGEIRWDDAVTKGGTTITTIQPADTRLRATRIEAAARRKRALLARYNGWSQGTKRHPHGLIGPAGESAVRSAIWESGALQPAEPGAGEVRELLGVRLPGALDSAGYLVPLDRHKIPQPPVTVLFEVKNLRSWVYPSAPELYQLLTKAALVQTAHPDQRIVPVFVCRKAHKTTFWMAQQLGFMAIDMGIQYAGDVDEEDLYEVRSELHFQDLARGSGPSLRVRDRLKDTLPAIAQKVAGQWAETCANEELTQTLRALRTGKANDLLAHLRAINNAMGRRGGW